MLLQNRYILKILSILFAVIVLSCSEAGEEPGLKPLEAEIIDIRSTGSDVEVEIFYEDGFRMGALNWVLWVGDQSFRLYRFPDDGDMRTLIFLMERTDFEKLESGSSVYVGYGAFIQPAGLYLGLYDKPLDSKSP